MPTDAPYTGGLAPGGRIFAVDGDFTILTPCSAPNVYCPFEGDSNPSVFDIILLDRTIDPPDYVSVPIGTGFNLQPFKANQSAIVIEQEFMVAASAGYQLPLNTLYDPAWGVGWGNVYQNLGNCFLVEEGASTPMGAGIVRVKLKFASLPANRNDYESYNATFPGLNYGGNDPRFGFSRIVRSRIFREFFVFDDLGLLSVIPLYPAGHRVESATPSSFPVMWEEFKGFKAAPDAVKNYNYLDPDQPLDDASDNPDTGLHTTPANLVYAGWRDLKSEIVAESSALDRWMGNIFFRKTRFVLAI